MVQWLRILLYINLSSILENKGRVDVVLLAFCVKWEFYFIVYTKCNVNVIIVIFNSFLMIRILC